MAKIQLVVPFVGWTEQKKNFLFISGAWQDDGYFYLLFVALEKLREEFKADSESLAHSEAISILSYDD